MSEHERAGQPATENDNNHVLLLTTTGRISRPPRHRAAAVSVKR